MRRTTAALGPILLALLALPVAAQSAKDSLPPGPTGELSAGEKLFQGAWRLGTYDDDSYLGKMEIDGRDFDHDGVHGKHTGYVTIRADREPAEIDFTIEDCGGCGFTGKTSTGIYRRDGEQLIFAGPSPGDPRPKDFGKPDQLWRMRLWDDAAEQERKQREGGG